MIYKFLKTVIFAASMINVNASIIADQNVCWSSEGKIHDLQDELYLNLPTDMGNYQESYGKNVKYIPNYNTINVERTNGQSKPILRNDQSSEYNSEFPASCVAEGILYTFDEQ